jgi:UDP-2,3-diacylglucosamine pyrophosphatase LpxH
MRLKTLVHISDIHLSDSNNDSKALLLYALIPKLDGFLGHSYQSLTMLDPFFADLVNSEDAELIVTGDVTRVGGVLEFDMARTYLEDEFKPPMGYYVGLRDTHSLTLAIPGNHDHYPGIPMLVGGPTSGLTAMFPNMPKVVTLPLGSRGHQLTFLLINTDADVGSWHPQRWAARGSFVSQLRTLKSQLGPKGEKEIRLLCLHHSRAHYGVTLEMDEVSRDELSNFIVRQGVAVLLSGHIHEPPLVKLATAVNTADDTDRAHYLEARSGTTTQRNLYHIPFYWRNILQKLHLKKRGHWSNTLLVHRISEIDGEIIWESELFWETPQDFEAVPPPYLYCMVDPKVRIWPSPLVPA